MKAQPVRLRNADRGPLTFNIGKNKQFERILKSVMRFSNKDARPRGLVLKFARFRYRPRENFRIQKDSGNLVIPASFSISKFVSGRDIKIVRASKS